MRVHGLHFMFTGATFLILFEPYHDMTESCFHNIYFNKSVNTSALKLWHVGSDNHTRLKRMTQDIYKPLRITTVYSLEHLLIDEQNALREVLKRAVRKMSSLLSIIRKNDLLLLPHSACIAILREGINKGKCVRMQYDYKGEYCLDRFMIPSIHVEGIAIYNLTHPEPIEIYKMDGPGLNNTDYVLYVTSQMTHLCNPFKSSAAAYAASCKLDKTGRPIAGQVNFCPRTVKTQKFDVELLYKTAVHELFHALGFSNKLFGKFKKCDSVGECKPWPQPVVKPVDGIMRLVTDAVVREMRKHFNCHSEPDFGGPVEIEYGKVTSHWNSLLMFSSVMGPKEQKPYQTLIDPISLAVFEDSGWYKVNYSLADKFIWGQGQGCSFGLPNFCKQQEGFCLKNVTGCHHLRLSKARCNVNTNILPSCGVFAADQKPCFTSLIDSSAADDEIYSPSSRCFLSSLRPAQSLISEKNSSFPEVTGKCYERRCEEDKYYLRVGSGDWQLCVPGSYILVEGFEGYVLCPSYEMVCSDFIHPELIFDITSTPASIFETNPTTPQDQNILMICSDETETSSYKFFASPMTLVICITAIICVEFIS